MYVIEVNGNKNDLRYCLIILYILFRERNNKHEKKCDIFY